MALPVGAVQALLYYGYVGRREAYVYQPCGCEAAKEVGEDSVGFAVGYAEVAFVGLTYDEVSGGGFAYYDFWDSDMTREAPDLGFV